jgi:hypothetical protein
LTTSHIIGASIRKVTINGYTSMAGRMSHTETTVLTEDKGEWNAAEKKLRGACRGHCVTNEL